MKPYDDPDCRCHELQAEINKRFPDADWNCDEACSAWTGAVDNLVDNGIEFDEGDDENYACTCPTCGRVICNWCV